MACTALVFSVLFLVASGAEARRPRILTATTVPMELYPRGDQERWTVVRIPAKGPVDIAGMEMENLGGDATLASHHLRVYALRPERNSPAILVRDRKVWRPGSSRRDEGDLVGGSQTVAKRQVAPDGLAIRLPVLQRARSRRSDVWLSVDSHWINGSDRRRKVRVRITLIPAKPPVKRYLKPIFEGTANAGIFVPQGTVRSTEDSTRALNERLAARGLPIVLNDSWGPGVFSVGNVAKGSGSLPSPPGPVCVTFLTAHMHLRGKLFAVDFIDSDGQVKNGDPRPELENPYEPGRFHLFTSRLYNDPAELHFDPPRYLVPGQRFHYACWHDNGVTAPPKLTCEQSAGLVPGASIADVVLGDAPGDFDVPCHQEGPEETECNPQVSTGRCVRANLVFGPTGDDDMCILPGAYYDPNPDASPGHECDLSLMPALP